MKKILLFIFIILVSLESVYAVNIVSFGDSIPYGYLLKDENNSYDNRIAQTLDADFYEYSAVGLTSYQLLDYLETGASDENIKNADYIFISIGSNDYLDLLFEIKIDGFEFDSSNDNYLNIKENFNFNNFFDSLKRSMTGEEFNNKARLALALIKETYPKIISYIRNINSDAKIYVLNLYNPYFNLNNPIIELDYVSDICEKYISETNEFIESSDEYTVINAHNLLRNYKMLNVDLLSLNLDPHPNKNGHETLYQAFLKELTYKVEVYDANDKSKIYYVLKGDKLEIQNPTKKGYKFVKWDKDLNNINSNLVVKPVFKKDYTIHIIVGVSLVVIIVLISILRKRKRA